MRLLHERPREERKKGGDDFEVTAAGEGTRKKTKKQRQEGANQPQNSSRSGPDVPNPWVGPPREVQVGLCSPSSHCTKAKDVGCLYGKWTEALQTGSPKTHTRIES